MNDFINKHKKLMIALAILLAGGVTGVLSYYQSNGQMLFQEQEKEPVNQTYTVELGNIESTVSGKGYVQAGQDLKISAPIGVIVKEVLVKNGDTVSAGQPLANIEPASIAGKLAEAVDRETSIQNLLDKNDLTSYQREALTGQRTGVRSYISQLRNLRDYPVITAPQNGIITSVYALDGQPVTVQNTLSSGFSQDSSGSSGTSPNVNLFIPNTQTPASGMLPAGTTQLITSQNTSTPDIVKISESPENGEVYNPEEGGQLFENNDTYLNGRSDFVPDTDSSNALPQTGSSSGSSSSSTSPSGGSIENYLEYTAYDAVVFKLGSMDQLSVNILVDERDILDIKPGQEAKIKLDALPDEELTGAITSISDNAQTGDGSSKYAVDVSLNTDKNLKSGMTANVTVSTGNNQNVPIIPIEALQEESGRKFVYTTESEDGTLGGEVNVTTGLSNTENVEITQGLQVGQTIYYPKPEMANDAFSEAPTEEDENTDGTSSTDSTNSTNE